MIEFVTLWWLSSWHCDDWVRDIVMTWVSGPSCSMPIHWVAHSHLLCTEFVLHSLSTEFVLHSLSTNGQWAQWICDSLSSCSFIEYWVRAAFIEYWVGGPFIEHEWAMSSVNLWFTEFVADLFVFVWFSWVFTSQERKKEEERMRRLGNLGQAAYSYMWLVEFVIDWLSSWSWCCDDLVI